MTWENGRFLPVLCRVSQNHRTHHESVPGGTEEGELGRGEERVGSGKRRKDEVREDPHTQHACTCMMYFILTLYM